MVIMGTNYYLYKKTNCECCGRPFDPMHIGKSSSGWCFSLHIIPEDNINTLEDWKLLWNKQGSIIRDEYDKVISVVEMEDIITNRSWVKNTNKKDQQWYLENHADQGPKNLARHKIDGRHCIGHGEGTWDYIVGEFS
jgi:hypothetical protein